MKDLALIAFLLFLAAVCAGALYLAYKALIAVDRKGAESLYEKIAVLNKEHGTNFAVTQADAKLTCMGEANLLGSAIFFDFEKEKIALVRNKKDIEFHDLNHIRSWSCFYQTKGTRTMHHGINVTVNDMRRPIVNVVVSSYAEMDAWQARLQIAAK